MTREDAIYEIKQLAGLSTNKNIERITEALNMAIEALQDEIWKDESQNKCHRSIEVPCYLYPSDEKCGNCKQWYSDEPQTKVNCGRTDCPYFKNPDYTRCANCKYEPKTEPQTEPLEQFRVGLEYHTDTTHFGKTKGESVTTNKIEDEPQTEYERASEQREHDILYEPTYDLDDGSM